MIRLILVLEAVINAVFLLRGSLLPSATKLRRICFYRCVSLHGGGGGGIPAGLACGIQACLAIGLGGGVPDPGGSAPGGGLGLVGSTPG